MHLLSGFLVIGTISMAVADNIPLSPTALTVTPEGKMLYVACATGNRVLFFDTAQRKVAASIPMPESPSGLALSPDNKRLYVTCAAPESKVCVVDVSRRKMISSRKGSVPQNRIFHLH